MNSVVHFISNFCITCMWTAAKICLLVLFKGFCKQWIKLFPSLHLVLWVRYFLLRATLLWKIRIGSLFMWGVGGVSSDPVQRSNIKLFCSRLFCWRTAKFFWNTQIMGCRNFTTFFSLFWSMMRQYWKNYQNRYCIPAVLWHKFIIELTVFIQHIFKILICCKNFS